MSRDAGRLFDLLPEYVRRRDAESGGTLPDTRTLTFTEITS